MGRDGRLEAAEVNVLSPPLRCVHLPERLFAAYVVKDSDEMFATWDFVASGVHGDAQPSVDFLRALEWRAALWMLGVLKMAKERMN